jgi:hypothetical protein
MRKLQLLGSASILLCLLLSSVFTTRVSQTTFAKGVTVLRDCNDCKDPNVKPEDCCKRPVRRNGEADPGCYCFTCAYGTTNAYVVCTQDENIKTTLFKLSENPPPVDHKQ